MMQLKTLYVLPGERQIVQSDWTAECEQRGTAVVSSAWESDGLTLSGQALSGNVDSVLIATPSGAGTGHGWLINTVTLANGEILKSEREVISQWL
jgi:hypothetical protein